MPGIFICACGDADGDAVGICIPGIFICACGDAEGDAVGICIPGIFICVCGDAEGEALGIRIPGIFIPGILPILFFIAGFVSRAFFPREVRLIFAILGMFIPDMFIPGILLMSWRFAVCFLREAFLFCVGPFDLGFA